MKLTLSKIFSKLQYLDLDFLLFAILYLFDITVTSARNIYKMHQKYKELFQDLPSSKPFRNLLIEID